MCGHTYDSKPLPIELAGDAFEENLNKMLGNLF